MLKFSVGGGSSFGSVFAKGNIGTGDGLLFAAVGLVDITLGLALGVRYALDDPPGFALGDAGLS